MKAPAMYYGLTVFDVNYFTALIVGLISDLVAGKAGSIPTSVSLKITANNNVVINEHGVGLPIEHLLEAFPDGNFTRNASQSLIEHSLDWLYTGGRMRKDDFGYLYYEGYLLNLLSTSFEVKTWHMNKLYRLGYEQGNVTTPLTLQPESIELSSSSGSEVLIRPDLSLVSATHLEGADIALKLADLQLQHPETQIEVDVYS